MMPGDLLGSTLLIFLYVADFSFNIWPLLIFGLVRPRGGILPGLLSAWCLLAAARVAVLFVSPENKLQSFLIEEPLNTYAFIVTGALIFIASGVLRATAPRRLARKFRHVRILDDFKVLTPRQFELACAVLYQNAGHKVQHRGRRGDHGVDLVVKSKDGKKWVVQCKRWNYPVGEKELRDLYGAMSHFKAEKAFLITTSSFTSPALKWSRGKPITLIDGSALATSWARMQAAQRKRVTPDNELDRPHLA